MTRRIKFWAVVFAWFGVGEGLHYPLDMRCPTPLFGVSHLYTWGVRFFGKKLFVFDTRALLEEVLCTKCHLIPHKFHQIFAQTSIPRGAQRE